MEGLQPKLQETPRIFFGLWSYLAGQTFLAIVLREDCLWAVRNLISEFKAVSGPETVVRQGRCAECIVWETLFWILILVFFSPIFYFLFLMNSKLRWNIEDGKSCWCGLCANCIVPETHYQPLTLDGTASTSTSTAKERLFKKDNSREYVKHGYMISFFPCSPKK